MKRTRSGGGNNSLGFGLCVLSLGVVLRNRQIAASLKEIRAGFNEIATITDIHEVECRFWFDLEKFWRL